MSDNQTTTGCLFDELPERPTELDLEAQTLLALLPDYGDQQSVMEVAHEDEAACRRLERAGLVKVHRWKTDPIAIRRTMYAGRLAKAYDYARTP